MKKRACGQSGREVFVTIGICDGDALSAGEPRLFVLWILSAPFQRKIIIERNSLITE